MHMAYGIWHMDESKINNTSPVRGISVLIQYSNHEKVIPFIKFDHNYGNVADYNDLVIAGLGIDNPANVDYAFWGLATGCGRP